jgi:hypothetical protein
MSRLGFEVAVGIQLHGRLSLGYSLLDYPVGSAQWKLPEEESEKY